MYIAVVPNRNSPPAILLRESYRQQGRVKNRTLANLSHWPPEKIEALRQVLKGAGSLGPQLSEAFSITRSRPHGHVAAVLGTLERLGLPALLDRHNSPQRRRVLALIAAQILQPGSKLATARALNADTCRSSLGESLELDHTDEDDLYAAMDWLLPRQGAIEAALARRHLGEGMLVLYDLTSTYFEGRHCPLARYGYSRDERPSNPQILFGVLSNQEGCPVAVEVFEGDTADPHTLAVQVTKLRERFQLRQLVLVGDRGMLTHKRIAEDLRPVDGLDWITALRAPQIQKLATDGALQMSLFDERDLAEIAHPDYPGERLIVCRNPLLAAERARKRQELLAAAEQKLDRIVAATQRPRRALKSRERIHYLVGRALAGSKVAKYFSWQITSEGFRYQRRPERIAQDAALDGIYVIRTSVSEPRLSAEQTVRTYKRLATVERAFRSLKSVDLQVRPIRHRLPDRVRAHVLICLLAYYVEWHMRRALAPVLFDDEQREASRGSPVAAAQRSPAARAKALRKRTPDHLPVQSFADWLRDLATIVKNRIEPKLKSIPAFEMITRPTPAQRRALELLQVSL
ncbi:MAG: IS1634 family transposase [Bryobacteraceae bacterium]|jgi:transposase|nr:IS1634 family transposase [Bryobacteraceae bacterium]